MSQWSFVIAAYAVTIVPIALLLALSWRSMREAERQVEELGERR